MNENVLQLWFLSLVIAGLLLAWLRRFAPAWEERWRGVGNSSAFWLGTVVGGLLVGAVLVAALEGGPGPGGGGQGVEAVALPTGPGRELFTARTCNNCHTVAGLSTGTVGPELTHVGSNTQIAGTVPMSRENMIRWIRNPPGVKPGTAMPNLGVGEADASALADFLLQLK